MIRILFAFASSLLLVGIGGLALAQDAPEGDAPEKTSKEDLAAAAIEEAKEKADEMSEAEVITASRTLAAFYLDEEVSDRTKKAIPKLIDDWADSKDPQIQIRGIEGLGMLGPGEGGKRLLAHLTKVLKDKELDEKLLGVVMTQLGTVADDSSRVTKQLVKLLKYKEDIVVGYAASALGGYDKADGKLRKELFEEIVKQSEGVFQRGTVGNDANQKRKWNIIGSKVMVALNKLSKQRFADPLEARQWFNDNKKNKDAWE